MFDNLFKPISLGNITLPNRACFLAHRTNFSKLGELNEKHIAYYTKRAMGGCGLIILGELCIHPDNRPWESMINFYDSKSVKDFKKFTDSIHKNDTRVFAQLNHHGFQSSGAITRKEVWGPSANSDISFGEVSKPMEPGDFQVVIDAFSNAAVIAKNSGFDGVEIDMGAESLLRQFLSPLTNQRQDEYGGSIENRMRFPIQILEAVKASVGEDFTVGIRLCVDEKFWGAIEPEEAKQFAKAFEEKKLADYINTTVGTYYNLHLYMASMHTPFGFTLDASEHLKEAVNIPVIATVDLFKNKSKTIVAEPTCGDAPNALPRNRFRTGLGPGTTLLDCAPIRQEENDVSRKDYDLFVIGAGSGGVRAARNSAGGHGVFPVPSHRHHGAWHSYFRGGPRRGRHSSQPRR